MNTPSLSVASFRPIDDLECELLDHWRAVSRATHAFLVLLREFDLRRGWRAYGNVDCADWLNWKCGISRVTAQEKVRVARALWLLPKIDDAFARGDLSYSKVRAVTRVATEGNESALLSYAMNATATQVEAYCRRLRNGDRDESITDAKKLHESRSLIRHFREDGAGTLSVELPRGDLELVLAALEAVASTLPDDPTRSLFAKGADALVQMARDVLAGRHEDARSSDNYQVLLHVDAAALSGAGGESDLPLPTVKRLCCDGSIVPVLVDDRGDPLNVGRKQRTVPIAIKRALEARDRTCVYPGCHHTRFLDAHHVQHWADGGETSLDNLLLLCATHHRLVHEGGFGIVRARDGRCYFRRPDGRPVEVNRRGADWIAHRVEEAKAEYRVVHLPRKMDSLGEQKARRIDPDVTCSTSLIWAQPGAATLRSGVVGRNLTALRAPLE